MKRGSYSEETKGKCIELTEKSRSKRAIMEELTVRNITKIKTWWRWIKGETHRGSQTFGKQYSYGKELEQK